MGLLLVICFQLPYGAQKHEEAEIMVVYPISLNLLEVKPILTMPL